MGTIKKIDLSSYCFENSKRLASAGDFHFLDCSYQLTTLRVPGNYLIKDENLSPVRKCNSGKKVVLFPVSQTFDLQEKK